MLLRYGQTLGDATEETVLPQDLLYQDLKVSNSLAFNDASKRLEKLDIGFAVQGKTSQEPHALPLEHGNASIAREMDPNAVRSLLFENQLQSVVVEV